MALKGGAVREWASPGYHDFGTGEPSGPIVEQSLRYSTTFPFSGSNLSLHTIGNWRGYYLPFSLSVRERGLNSATSLIFIASNLKPELLEFPQGLRIAARVVHRIVRVRGDSVFLPLRC